MKAPCLEFPLSDSRNMRPISAPVGPTMDSMRILTTPSPVSR